MHKPETPAEALRNLSRMAADGFTDWPSLGHITASPKIINSKLM